MPQHKLQTVKLWSVIQVKSKAQSLALLYVVCLLNARRDRTLGTAGWLSECGLILENNVQGVDDPCNGFRVSKEAWYKATSILRNSKQTTKQG